MVNGGKVVVLPSTTTTPPEANETATVPLVNPGPPGERVEVPTTISDASSVIVSSGLTVITMPAPIEVIDEAVALS